jgi:hypothetical protein
MSSLKTVLHGIQYASMSTKNILSMQSSEEINYTVVHAQALACTFTLTHTNTKTRRAGEPHLEYHSPMETIYLECCSLMETIAKGCPNS